MATTTETKTDVTISTKKPVLSLKHPTPLWLRMVVRGLLWLCALWGFILLKGFKLTSIGISPAASVKIMEIMTSITGLISLISRFIGVKPVSIAAFSSLISNQINTMEEEVTGYYIDLTSDTDTVTSINGDSINMPAADYAGTGAATLNSGTAIYYPTLEWNAAVEINAVVIDGTPVEVKILLGGRRPIPKPK